MVNIMFLVTFYQFSKRENSTKVPTENVGDIFTTYQCMLKDDCSVANPILWLNVENLPTTWNPSGWNYAYIPDFKRYYYVTDWVWRQPHWEAHLKVDPMSSFRTQILANTKYVLRSASDYDQEALDDAYCPTAQSTIAQNRTSIPYYEDNSGIWTGRGRFVLGVAGQPESQCGDGINYYVFNILNFRKFLGYLYTNILGMDWQSNQDWNAVISKAIVDPMDYIVSAFWVPLAMTFQDDPSGDTFWNDYLTIQYYNVKFGFWEYNGGQSGWVSALKRRVVTLSVDLTNPPNPYHTGMAWELLPPYTKYTINLGAGGIHPLNGQAVRNAGGVHVDIKIDMGSGVAVYVVSSIVNHNIVFLTTSAQFCPPVPIGRQKSDILGMISSAVNGVGDIARGIGSGHLAGVPGAIAGGLVGAGNAIIGTGASILSSTSANVSGSIGSAAALTEYISLDLQCINHQPENNADLGRPLCRNRLLNTLSGFTVCADGEIDYGSQCYDEERETISRHLTQGFYIE